jgi:hypothetical protein
VTSAANDPTKHRRHELVARRADAAVGRLLCVAGADPAASGAAVLDEEEGARACSALLRFALLHLAPPGTGLLAAGLDQLREPLEVAMHLILDDSEEIARAGD